MSRSEIDRICGDCSAAVSDYLDELYSSGFLPKHVLAIVQAVLELRTCVETLSLKEEIIPSFSMEKVSQ